jgi:hypothetical protein
MAPLIILRTEFRAVLMRSHAAKYAMRWRGAVHELILR